MRPPSPKSASWEISKYGGPGEIRTPDLTVRSRSLYPTELRAPKIILLQGLRKSLCPASSTLVWRFVFWTFIPQWIKNTSAFGDVLFFSPDDRRSSRLFLWKRIVHRIRWDLPSLRHVHGQTRRQKKKELDEHPKDLLENNPFDEFHRRLAYILRCTHRRKSCSPQSKSYRVTTCRPLYFQ